MELSILLVGSTGALHQLPLCLRMHWSLVKVTLLHAEVVSLVQLRVTKQEEAPFFKIQVKVKVVFIAYIVWSL